MNRRKQNAETHCRGSSLLEPELCSLGYCFSTNCRMHSNSLRISLARCEEICGDKRRKHTWGTAGAQSISVHRFLYTSRQGGLHCARHPLDLWRSEGDRPRWTRYRGTADG